jgi:hypothetical protein
VHLVVDPLALPNLLPDKISPPGPFQKWVRANRFVILSLSCALLLFPALCRCGVTSDFFINELYAKCYLPLLSKKGIEALYVAVYYLLIDPPAIESLL